MTTARSKDDPRIDRAARAVFEWHLERSEGQYSAAHVRGDLAREHPIIRPKSDDCRDTQVAIWRRVLRKAEEIAFNEGWYLTPVPGGKPDDRILTQNPKEINRGIEKLYTHAYARMETTVGYLQRVTDSVKTYKPSDLLQLDGAVRSLEGAMASLESVSPRLKERRARRLEMTQ